MLMLFRDGKKGCKITCALKLELDSLFFVLLQSHVDSDSLWLASCEKNMHKFCYGCIITLNVHPKGHINYRYKYTFICFHFFLAEKFQNVRYC